MNKINLKKFLYNKCLLELRGDLMQDFLKAKEITFINKFYCRIICCKVYYLLNPSK